MEKYRTWKGYATDKPQMNPAVSQFTSSNDMQQILQPFYWTEHWIWIRAYAQLLVVYSSLLASAAFTEHRFG